jgi:hypothetical protein
MSRDERDYASMGRDELRVELVRVAKDLAGWQLQLAICRQDENREFLTAFQNATARAVNERQIEARTATTMFRNELLEAEGQVLSLQTTRDMVNMLLKYQAGD